MKNRYLLLLLLASCSHTSNVPVKPNIVLIQGLHLDESSWNNVKYSLVDRGYEVITFNRVGRDSDEPQLLRVIAQQSCELTPKNSTVVGHSFGGAIIAEMAGLCAEKFKKIIYISAVVPLAGELPMAQVSSSDKEHYGKAVNFKGNGIRPGDPRKFFKVTDPGYKYDKVSEPKLYSESMNLNLEPVDYNQKVFDRIPKSYIHTTNDQILGMTTQKLFTDRTRIRKTAQINSGHYPMYSNPETLAKLIAKFAE